jgi:hypothetical protein
VGAPAIARQVISELQGADLNDKVSDCYAKLTTILGEDSPEAPSPVRAALGQIVAGMGDGTVEGIRRLWIGRLGSASGVRRLRMR